MKFKVALIQEDGLTRLKKCGQSWMHMPKCAEVLADTLTLQTTSVYACLWR